MLLEWCLSTPCGKHHIFLCTRLDKIVERKPSAWPHRRQQKQYSSLVPKANQRISGRVTQVCSMRRNEHKCWDSPAARREQRGLKPCVHLGSYLDSLHNYHVYYIRRYILTPAMLSDWLLKIIRGSDYYRQWIS